MAADSATDDRPFEDDLARLEAIVDQLETDPPPLDDALDAYEEGVTLAQRCLDRLDAAEQRMQELEIEQSDIERTDRS
ncbi:MAG: exodeoxyribonuclease VII small subunit [Longimonas sp.]|uniref:exodeoxyribonuclease VII small subunit n=1 Tax=Longimonas sp. TaxID=2039626 RepID=UPI00397536A0